MFVGISRNDKEFKDFDESDTKRTVFSGNDLIYKIFGKFQRSLMDFLSDKDRYLVLNLS